MSIKPLRSLINNNAWAILLAIGTLVVGYVYAITDKRYPLRSEFEQQGVQIEAHEARLVKIEAGNQVATSQYAALLSNQEEAKKDIKDIASQLNRIVGAMEARREIPPQHP